MSTKSPKITTKAPKSTKMVVDTKPPENVDSKKTKDKGDGSEASPSDTDTSNAFSNNSVSMYLKAFLLVATVLYTWLL
jgi:hypothetical protein